MTAAADWRIAGGILWHARAILRSHGAWRPFRKEIDRWLTSWPPRKREIILVGASAGWCIPTSFLLRFERIVAVDPDRVGRFFFFLRHGRALRRAGVAVAWRHEDFFSRAQDLLAECPQAAVLFCNVLGQMRFMHDDPLDVVSDLRNLSDMLRGRAWASFHDLLSGVGEPARDLRRTPGHLPGEDILRSFGLDGEWLDHLTGDVLPSSTPRRVIAWRFGGRRVHLVEAGFVEDVTSQPS